MIRDRYNTYIMITGIGGPAGRSAVTYFKKRGYSIIGLDMRYVEEDVDYFFQVPPADDPLFPDVLVRIIEDKRPGLLIPTVTEELPIISRLRKCIEKQGCRVFISSPITVDITNDKLKTAMILAGHGIPVPVSIGHKEPVHILMETIGFPLLSKPRCGRGGRNVCIYWKKEDLLYTEDPGNLVFQEFIPGDEFDVNIFFNKKKEMKACIVLKKLLLKEGTTGNALAVERVRKDDVADIAIRAATVLQMEGPVDIDVRLRRDGSPVILEINARIGGNILNAQEILDSLLQEWEEEGMYVYP